MSAAKIAELNDALRKSFSPTLGKIMMTAGVAALPSEIRAELFHKVQTFDAFTEDNDPHHEHDMAFFEVNGRKWYFKIDYYDLKIKLGSPDPADLTKTCRVMTIGAAEDY